MPLTRRYNLIPNVVEIAKGYMAHENSTLAAVILARNAAHGALSALKSASAIASEKKREYPLRGYCINA